MKNDVRVSAVILFGGIGARMGADVTKQRLRICGKSVFYRAVEAFEHCDVVDEIILVVREEEMDFARGESVDFRKVTKLIPGGNTRAQSAAAGVAAIEDDCGLVMIHDGARCLVSVNDIEAVAKDAIAYGAASASCPIYDTVKCVNPDGKIASTVDRDMLRAVQTPQCTFIKTYKSALDKMGDVKVTDDNSLLEMIGVFPYCSDTSRDNIKITTKEDVLHAECIIRSREFGREENDEKMNELRIGHGYDVHRFAEGRALILGGVNVPSDKGLLGHSDADVLIHAIMDAIIGALGEGDIGKLFPDSDMKFKGISSLLLLKEVKALMDSKNASLVNLDATLVMQAPKIQKYTALMQKNIAGILNVPVSRINVKATTEERLGFTGSGEGAAAHSVALLRIGV